MPFACRCPHCGAEMGVLEERAGTGARCPSCQRALTLPTAPGLPATPLAEPPAMVPAGEAEQRLDPDSSAPMPVGEVDADQHAASSGREAARTPRRRGRTVAAIALVVLVVGAAASLGWLVLRSRRGTHGQTAATQASGPDAAGQQDEAGKADRAATFVKQGLEAKSAGRLGEARQKFEDAIKFDDSNWEAHHGLGWLFASSDSAAVKGRARDEFQKVVELSPSPEIVDEASEAADRMTAVLWTVHRATGEEAATERLARLLSALGTMGAESPERAVEQAGVDPVAYLLSGQVDEGLRVDVQWTSPEGAEASPNSTLVFGAGGAAKGLFHSLAMRRELLSLGEDSDLDLDLDEGFGDSHAYEGRGLDDRGMYSKGTLGGWGRLRAIAEGDALRIDLEGAGRDFSGTTACLAIIVDIYDDTIEPRSNPLLFEMTLGDQ